MMGPVPLTFDILAVLQSDLARQSLYVKFDPLVEARSDQVAQDSNSFPNINPADLLFQGPISTDDLLGMDTPPAKPVVSRRALLAQSQNTETEESTATSTIAPVDLFELSPSQDITPPEDAEEATTSKSESSIIVTEEESSLVQPLQFSKKDLDKAVEDEQEKLLSQWNLQNSLHEAEMEKLLDERNKILEERNKIMDENKVVKTLMMEYEQTMAQMISKTNCNALLRSVINTDTNIYVTIFPSSFSIFVPTIFLHSAEDRENEQSQQEKSNSEIAQERDQVFDEIACQE
ncbi:Hypothetical predicted protein [Paramuricea clavata]|uniref:Uncharacterized protein n=1 Tax=Paramuricea clavata TaxID=317549 RepID=A0A6S7I0A8_PARCT|nr:Hypothetical predicted protein [Paramuricea clavata]